MKKVIILLSLCVLAISAAAQTTGMTPRRMAEVARQACPRGVTLCVPAGSAKDYRNDPYRNRYVEIREVKQ